jgi:hypothetical protein
MSAVSPSAKSRVMSIAGILFSVRPELVEGQSLLLPVAKEQAFHKLGPAGWGML